MSGVQPCTSVFQYLPTLFTTSLMHFIICILWYRFRKMLSESIPKLLEVESEDLGTIFKEQVAEVVKKKICCPDHILVADFPVMPPC